MVVVCKCLAYLNSFLFFFVLQLETIIRYIWDVINGSLGFNGGGQLFRWGWKNKKTMRYIVNKFEFMENVN